MLYLDRVPVGTGALLNILSTQCPDIGKFALIGGTALTLHIGHRISEDLDFSIGERKLDRRGVERIVETLMGNDLEVVDTMPLAAREQSIDEGEDLDDIQRNFAVSGGVIGSEPVKLTFVIHGDYRADTEYLKQQMPTCIEHGYVKIASIDTIFASKCVALADRIKSRDLFDLWWLTHRIETPWSVEDIFRTVQHFRPGQSYETTRARLLSYPIPSTDEGFASLISEPISVDSIRVDFGAEVIAMEEEMLEESRPEWEDNATGDQAAPDEPPKG